VSSRFSFALILCMMVSRMRSVDDPRIPSPSGAVNQIEESCNKGSTYQVTGVVLVSVSDMVGVQYMRVHRRVDSGGCL
jgi:hypothetical protein